MPYRVLLLLTFVFVTVLQTKYCAAADEGWKAVGVRAGTSMTTKNEYFHQYEVYAQYGLPLHWRAESGWGLTMQWDVGLGDLHGAKTDAFIGSMGPSITFDKNGRGIAVEVGGDVNYINRKRFGDQNFGSHFLFDAHASLSYILQNGLGIGYRAQHMSNAGFNGTNTGLDLNMLVLSWHF